MDFDLTSESPEQTIEIGRRIGSQLRGGEVVGVYGPLGSGKTHLIKGVAEGAGARDAREVTSPTFVIVNEYAGRLYLYHVDAYRLSSLEQFEMIGFDDYCRPDSVVVIEWADKVEAALKGIDVVHVELCCAAERKREIRIKNAPAYISP
jgi:tRNA threonylcarbamoyladenosine biosynthesis protein TsaE